MIDVQSLLLAAKRGNTNAVEDIIAAYRHRVQRQAQAFAGRFPSVDVDDVESAMMMALYRCIEKYDPDRGIPFEHMLNNAFTREANGVLYKAMSSKRAQLDVTNIEDIVSHDDVDVEAEVIADVAVIEYYRMVGETSPMLVTVMRGLAEGAPYDVIAERCGHVGSKKAKETWTTIMVDRIRKIMKEAMGTCKFVSSANCHLTDGVATRMLD